MSEHCWISTSYRLDVRLVSQKCHSTQELKLKKYHLFKKNSFLNKTMYNLDKINNNLSKSEL